MFKNRASIGFAAILLLFFLSGCGEYEKLLKSRDYKLKWETGLKYYEDGEYGRAATLIDQVSNIYRGTTKADTVKYYQAKTYYAQKDYLMAGHYFNELSLTYPNSVFLEEADYMTAYCFYLQSPRPELDQDNTFKAITQLQMFMVRYPTLDKVSECQKLVLELTDKIGEKSYISAKLYFDLGYYKAATALRNSLIDYPETSCREELMFMILKSSYLLADGSILSKKMERFQAALDEYYSFISEFPEGPHSREAKRMYESTSAYLESNSQS
ncbi:MAG: outer membrane protein assembly factor BamD [Bacteroidales bacterium]